MICPYLSRYVVPNRWLSSFTRMSHMTIVSLIAGCLVSSSPPSSKVVFVGSMFRMVLRS